MKVISVIKNQSLMDISIQVYGNLEGIITLCLHNNLSITEELESGQKIEVPLFENTKTEIVDYFFNRGISPATAITEQQNQEVIPDDGCNYCKLFE